MSENLIDNVIDNVNHPSHYENGCSIECIEAMELAYGKAQVVIFCKLNAFKYLWRYKNKNGLEDLCKANWYLSYIRKLNCEMYDVTYDDRIESLLEIVKKHQEALEKSKEES